MPCSCDCCPCNVLRDSLAEHVGKVVSVFTQSGGASGCGFTGILSCVRDCTIRLVTQPSCSPACPISRVCCGPMAGNSNCGCGNGNGNGSRTLGSITEIPICAIVAFTYNDV